MESDARRSVGARATRGLQSEVREHFALLEPACASGSRPVRRPVSWPPLARKSRIHPDRNRHYYLKRASWKSQEEFKTHVLASWPEYNHRYAHPFEWTWTNQKMRSWFAKHAL